jgi:predicted Zn-dependent peptidase
LAITKDNLDNQRNAVQEERRLGVDNRAYGLTFEKVDQLIYDNFAYKHSVIGSMEDLNAASVDDVREFFRIYYAPNNAVLAIVGDVDTQATIAKVRKYFGDIPKQPAPPPTSLAEPPATEERRETLQDKLARVPMVLIAYKLPSGNDNRSIAVSVLNQAFAAGESSRLYQKLVKEKELATSISGILDLRIGPSLYAFIAMVRPGKDPKDVEAAITEEVARLSAEPLTDRELLRARSVLRRNAVQMRERSLSRANALADAAVMYNDPDRINTLLDRQTAVTAEDIQRTAREYLKTTNRAVLTTLPAAAQGGRP